MYCDACGLKLEDGQSFCRACGKAAGAAAPSPRLPAPRVAVARVASHLRVLAVLWIAAGVIRLIPGVFLLAFSHWQLPQEVPADVQGFIHPLLNAVGWVFMIAAGASFVAAWGLLERQPWARLLAIVAGAIVLVEVPLGTALGIYTLWVLLPQTSEVEYRQLAEGS